MSETSIFGTHLYVAMTTTDETQSSRENIMTSSLSRGSESYIQCAALVIGIVGMATNALILYAMIASKQHKKHMLIFNQNVLDCVGCVLVIITYSVKLSNIFVSGTTGYLLCMLVLSETLITSTLVGSVINLAVITIERYLKIAHSTWSQNHQRKWITYTTVAFPWLTPVVYHVVVVPSSYVSVGMDVPNADLIGGACSHAYETADSIASTVTGGVMIFIYVCVLLIFIFCYWRILIVIRRQQ